MATISEITVFPWLKIDKPMMVCGVEFLPRYVAIERAEDMGRFIEYATSYFYESSMLREGPASPIALSPVQPAVVLMSEENTSERVDIASNVLTFAAVAANNAISYSNSTTFEHFTQRLGGELGTYARRTRRLTGSKLDGAMVYNILDTRPPWCGKYLRHNDELAKALASIIFTDAGKPIQRSLRALVGALTDADTIDLQLERSLFGRAAEFLLHDDADGRGKRRHEQLGRGKRWLRPLLGYATLNADDPTIMKAWDAVRRDRNNFWHPERGDDGQAVFEKQSVVHFNLIAFKMIEALIIARLFMLGAIGEQSKLRFAVPGIEGWLNSIVENDSRDPWVASNVGLFIVEFSMGVYRKI